MRSNFHSWHEADKHRCLAAGPLLTGPDVLTGRKILVPEVIL